MVGVDSRGTVVVRKRCSRAQLLAYTGNIRVHRIGMEACSGSHLLGRALRQQGHEVGDILDMLGGFQLFRVVGGPDWMRTDRYDIEAKADQPLEAWHTAIRQAARPWRAARIVGILRT